MGFFNFLKESKIGRILVFLFIFIFVFRTIDYVLQFFDVNIEMGYTFFIWMTILFLLFALLPVQWSGYFLTKKESGAGDAGADVPISAAGGGDSGGFGFGASSSSAAASEAGAAGGGGGAGGFGASSSSAAASEAGGAAGGGGGAGAGPALGHQNPSVMPSFSMAAN